MANFIAELETSEYWRYRYYSYTLIALFLGSILFVYPAATRLLYRFHNEFKIAKNNKERVDKVVELYGIKYTLDLTFTKNEFDIEEVDIDLTIQK